MKKFLISLVVISIILGGSFFLFKKNTSSKFNTNIDLEEKDLHILLIANNKEYEEMEKEIFNTVNNLNIELIQNGEIVDFISFKELDIETNISEQLQEAKKINDNYWGFDKFTQQTIPIDLTISFKEETIRKQLNSLNCLQNYTESQNAYLDKIDGEMKIIPEIYGTKINKEKLLDLIGEALETKNLSINLDEADIYEKPTIFSDDSVLNEKASLYNKVVNLNVEYTFGDKTEKITKEQLSDWIDLGENELIFNAEKMLSYIKELAHTYNTFGTTRLFTTTNGEKIKIPAGDYGWSISQTKEVARLIEELKEGNDIKREPTWLYQGYGSYINENGCDIGNSYVEISIPTQTLWLYVDGNLILTSEFVSGTESNGNYTPSGVFGITYKTRNAVLRGQGYASPVKYWMPFNGNIGMHDASWRSSFGGSIYKNNGSHGCINLPTESAKQIYEYMDTFFPVIVYRQTELDNAE